jgi:hypothetical protein
MHQQRVVEIRPEHGTGWLDWAGRHPGLLLLGTLVVTVLAFSESTGPEDSELDASGEEVPLFI